MGPHGQAGRGLVTIPPSSIVSYRRSVAIRQLFWEDRSTSPTWSAMFQRAAKRLFVRIAGGIPADIVAAKVGGLEETDVKKHSELMIGLIW